MSLRRSTAALTALTLAMMVSTTGCAALGGATSFEAHGPSATVEPRLAFTVTEPSSDFERETPTRDQDNGDKKAVTVPLFWTGVGATALGGATMIGGAVTGTVRRNQLTSALEESASASELDDLRSSGDAANVATIVGGTVFFVGLILASVVAGIDHTRCGPVVTKKRRRECAER